MDKIAKYREAVRELIRRHSQYRPSLPGLESYTVQDTEGDHYQIVRTGWADQRWYYGVILHFDIKDGKIWIQHNGTEYPVAWELVELGVPKEDIVLGFQSPFMRTLGDFAAA
jgi:hypothetical protein